MTETIQKIEPCNHVRSLSSDPKYFGTRNPYSYSDPTPEQRGDAAVRALEAAREKDVAAHEQNLPAIVINAAIQDQVTSLMASVGMPKSHREKDPRSRSAYGKMMDVASGYLGDLRRHVITDDGFGFATSTYEELKRRFEEYLAKAKQDAEMARTQGERDRAAQLEARKKDLTLAAILLRYDLPLETDWPDVLSALLQRDKRADLAHTMEQTRGDWSDGPRPVRHALERFHPETEEEDEIVDSIRPHVSDWDGDGRIFRDCDWNYSRLWASIQDRQLVADIRTAIENASCEW